ncbi:MAG: MFS transporter [Clostridia bacterium]|nr:MFS transporter [Clostridia bacterium]
MDERKRRFEYKWVIAALSFVMIFVGLGFFSSTRSLFVLPITEALSIPRSAFSLTDTCRFLSTAITNLFFGTLVAKFGAKKLVGFGFLCLCLSALCFSFSVNVWMCYLGGVLMGVGFSFGSTTIVSYVINHWFAEKKGTVMGAVLAANGLGGALASQILSPIINAHANGFRDAYRLLALLFFGVGIVLILFFKNKPKEPITPTGNAKRRGRDWVGIPFAQAVRSWYFYGIAVCIFLTGVILQGVFGTMAAHLRDVGFSADFVTTVLSIQSLSMTVFKFLTGVMYDRFGLRTTATVCSVTAVVTGLMFALASPGPVGTVMAIVFGIFSSLAMPLETIVVPLYASDLFGQKSFDHILGILISVNTAGYALASPILNLSYDLCGSYTPALLVSCTIMAGVVILLQFVIHSAHVRQREIETE